ncbi:MAG: OsmC family peroxiredoxin [Planctomycetota bacterium]|nr:MAG: OsmC family peroxiredoxin [Planctomycetota bacterium]
MDLITVTRKEGLAFDVRVRGHRLTCDMSEKDGGRDEGPSPAEMLAGSLGACVAMMVQRYCDNHGYTDGDVCASLTLELADNPKRIGGIVIDLELPNDFPEDRKSAVKRLAELCPIHETLKHLPKVDLEIT